MEDILEKLNKLTLNNNSKTLSSIIITTFIKNIVYNKKLKNLLNKPVINFNNHKINILKENSLKKAHIYCKINNLSGQVFGPLLEYYIINKFNAIKSNSNKSIGDFIYNNKNYELKCSLGGVSNDKFNYVQIRLNHECDFIFTAYIINSKNLNMNGNLFVFHISHNNMLKLCQDLKLASYAHGTKKSNIDKNILDLEYSIRLKYNSTNWNNFMKYCIFKN